MKNRYRSCSIRIAFLVILAACLAWQTAWRDELGRFVALEKTVDIAGATARYHSETRPPLMALICRDSQQVASS